jgi:predicted transposase YbfD/YdcC
MNVFNHEHGFTLAQTQSQSTGGYEVAAVLECLELLDIKGTLVSVDAQSGVKKVTDQIRTYGGDYLIPIKKDQRNSFKELEVFFSTTPMISNAEKTTQSFTKEKGHGRIEHRYVSTASASHMSEEFRQRWQDVQSVVRIFRTRDEKDNRHVIQETGEDGKQYYRKNTADRKLSQEVVYFISSRKLTAAQALTEVREHWSIENKLHWSLDVVFSEDQWRVKHKTAARNLSVVRKFAFNLIKKCHQKGSQRIKMKRAAWNNEYLESLVLG